MASGISIPRGAARAAALLIATVASLATGCRAPANGGTPSTASASAPMTAEWRSLIDPSLSQWRGYREQSVPDGWRVVDGMLTKGHAGINDLITREEFGDFEIEFDWRLEKGGNAGFFYRGSEEYDKVYWSAVEYQLLDDANHRDGRNPLTSAAAAYGLYSAPRGAVRPAGEWNRARVVARGTRVEHWLNGQQTAAYDVASPEWAEKIRGSKFTPYPNFARASRGRFAIQGDHEGALSIRDMRVRTLTGGRP